ncbi:hypothetical protein MPLB_1640058 [Mesorhizobium sp. ORS 3324]|nr:hypothetical protein MPLB_1640058 [Mesorhizobium sp. ORS 3324]
MSVIQIFVYPENRAEHLLRASLEVPGQALKGSPLPEECKRTQHTMDQGVQPIVRPRIGRT